MTSRFRSAYWIHWAVLGVAVYGGVVTGQAQQAQELNGQQRVAPLAPDIQAQINQAAAAATLARSGPYMLRAGDELDIRCVLIPQLDQTVRVRPDGKISLVLVNDVNAAGLTATELGDSLSEAYSKHYRNPQITAIVRTFYNLNVFVGGEVLHAGLVPIGGGLTAAAAVFQAGGFKDEEGLKTVVLLRQTPQGTPSVTNFDLTEVLLHAKPDISLEPSDVLFVPKTSINVYVGGEVTEPGLVPLSRKMTALSAIIRARGLKPTAQAHNAMLIRNTGQPTPAIQKFDLAKIMAHGLGDIELQPYDIVYIPKSKIARVDQFVDQYMRQVLPIGMNFGFSYLLGTGYIP